MEPEAPASAPAPPPEALLIRTAREAAGMTAAQAAAATNGAVSATYWRDVERGHGGRRGKQAPARASARLLAAMAEITGATPDQLKKAQREDAARVLEEILRRKAPPVASAPSLRPVPSRPAAADPESPAEVVLRELVERYADDGGVQYLGSDENPTRSAEGRIADILEWLTWRRERRSGRNGTAG
jgi:transcriptional regulator with XRE-family HTH domain